MKPFRKFPPNAKGRISHLLTDIDDTLTTDGLLPAAAYQAMEALDKKDIKVIPVTGRPAGWCDHIARMWPVHGVVGENGAFYFYYDRSRRRMLRRYWNNESFRRRSRAKLTGLRQQILAEVPGARVSADQLYRESDLAIDFCEDVARLSDQQISSIVSLFKKAGAQAKISSIHVNGWFGNFDKLKMTRKLFKEMFCLDLDEAKERIIFTGDSPNDAPMFRFFPHSVGVANVGDFADRLSDLPVWVTQARGGQGFAEMAAVLLDR